MIISMFISYRARERERGREMKKKREIKKKRERMSLLNGREKKCMMLT